MLAQDSGLLRSEQGEDEKQYQKLCVYVRRPLGDDKGEAVAASGAQVC